ncbi:MAG: aldehyde dehydrogenase family protein, partial [Oceanisphaera sp.]|uniref:aldehyde dehydrogenase family protein n=1 Tax=Oceanisphaera sp. TaxID=1929979 RepID=UPI003C72BB22
MNTIPHLINGERHHSTNTLDVYNPSTGLVCSQLCMGDENLVAEAVAVAKAAFPAWRDTPPAKRARVMFRFKQLLEDRADDICALISEEHGKTLEDARGELQRGIENVEYACGVPELLKGDYTRNVGPNIDAWSDLQPLGVVAGITPFNFPAVVPLWM